MQYQPGIILAGQGMNVVQDLAGGWQAGQMANEVQDANALRSLYQEQGAAIRQGDTNALNALAMLNPGAALGVEETRLGMDSTRQQMRIREEQLQMARAAGARAAANHVRTLSAEQASQEREQIARGLATAIPALRSGDLDTVNQILRTAGLEAADDIDSAAMTVALYDGALEHFDNAQSVLGGGAEPDFITINDQLVDRAAPGGPTVVPVQGLQTPAPELPATVQALQWRAEQAGLVPGTPEFQEFMATGGRVPDGGVNVSIGDVGTGANDDYYSRLDRALGESHAAIIEESRNIPSRVAQIDELEHLLTQSGSGVGQALQVFAGNWGIPTEGLDELQAAQAIIQRLIPAQRLPGSGPLSDADLEIFRQSLPRIINQPGGNQRIIETLRGIAVYETQIAEIARRAARREITPAEAEAAMAEVSNPLAVTRGSGPTNIGGLSDAAASFLRGE